MKNQSNPKILKEEFEGTRKFHFLTVKFIINKERTDPPKQDQRAGPVLLGLSFCVN